MAEDQLTKITIIRDQDALLVPGDGEHLPVRERPRVVVCNDRDVVAGLAEMGRYT
jgi:hypothetical protein